MELATLTSKGQVTVPKAVRDALGLKQGDQLSGELEDGSVGVRAVAPLDLVISKAGRPPWPSGAARRMRRRLAIFDVAA
jgi:AbrB family looped-hinge helix DNA binding protein